MYIYTYISFGLDKKLIDIYVTIVYNLMLKKH